MAMSRYHEHLIALRAELTGVGLNGFLLATGDEHITEYPAAYAKRLAWLTGFKGSTGSAVVLMDRAALFVDGRYTVAARDQVDGDCYQIASEIGRAHVLTPVTNAPLVCRLLLETKTNKH